MISVFLLSFWFVCCSKGYPLYQQFPSKMLLGMDKSWTIIMTSMSGKLASASWSLLALASIPGAAQGHHVIFHAKGPPCPLPHIYHCYISYIIYHCCILVGTNNAATRWWQSLRNSPLPFLLSPTPLAFVIHPRPQVCWFSFLLHQEIIRSSARWCPLSWARTSRWTSILGSVAKHGWRKALFKPLGKKYNMALEGETAWKTPRSENAVDNTLNDEELLDD